MDNASGELVSPLNNLRVKRRCFTSSKNVRPLGSTCCIPMMLHVKKNKLVVCGRSSALGVCMRSQGSPFIECSEYLKQFATDEDILNYFVMVSTQSEEDFVQTQQMFALHLFNKMIKSVSKETLDSTTEKSKQLAITTAETFNKVEDVQNRLDFFAQGTRSLLLHTQNQLSMMRDKRRKILGLPPAPFAVKEGEEPSGPIGWIDVPHSLADMLRLPNAGEAMEEHMTAQREEMEFMASQKSKLQKLILEQRLIKEEMKSMILENKLQELDPDHKTFEQEYEESTEYKEFQETVENPTREWLAAKEIKDKEIAILNAQAIEEYKQAHARKKGRESYRRAHSSRQEEEEPYEGELPPDNDTEMEDVDYDKLIDAENRGNDRFDHE